MIVVIRQNGCVEWTKKFKNIIIFNKGEPLSDEYNCINIPNIGREFHTIFTYIYNNYDNLDNYIIFITVDERIYDKISNNMVNRIEYYLNNEINIDFEFITKYKDFLHTGSIIKESESENENIITDVQNAFTRIYIDLFSILEYKYVYKSEGSSFIVSKKMMQARRKDFYLKIIKALEYNESPIEHFVIEFIIEKIFIDRYTNFEITYTDDE
jgi:hypothetical protein